MRIPWCSSIWPRYSLKRSLACSLFLFLINKYHIREVRIRHIILQWVFLELLLVVHIQLVDRLMRRTLLIVQKVFSILFIAHLFIWLLRTNNLNRCRIFFMNRCRWFHFNSVYYLVLFTSFSELETLWSWVESIFQISLNLLLYFRGVLFRRGTREPLDISAHFRGWLLIGLLRC